MKTSGIHSDFLISKLIDLLFYIEVEKRLTFNKNLGLFGVIPAWSDCFGPISEVSCLIQLGRVVLVQFQKWVVLARFSG